jgi:hypothetical protein
MDTLKTIEFTFGGDTNAVKFKVQVLTKDTLYGDSLVKDGKIVINAKLWPSDSSEPLQWNTAQAVTDNSPDRNVQGYCGIIIYYHSTSLTATGYTEPVGIRLRDFIIQKLTEDQ